jgi:hypothetical protein
MRKIIIVCFLIIPELSYAGDINFAAKDIPVQLLKNADAVKRIDATEFSIINLHHTREHNHYAITVLNENGDEHAVLHVMYDKLSSVESIEGTLYDAEGRVVKRIKNKDIRDVSATDNFSMALDSRMKTFDFYYKSYPYTVEYDIVTENNNTFLFPNWAPQDDDALSVESSEFTIQYPTTYKVNYRAFYYKGSPEQTTDKGNINQKWQVKNLTAFKVPFASSLLRELAPVVYFSPSEFEIGNYKGNMNSWKEFGEFQTSLNAGKDVLPQNVIQQITPLLSGVTDTKEKIKILYQFLQHNTRYISIQLGIGGWQPFDAAYVAKNGFGDCKALSNYMYSLLKYAGIRSLYTLVYAGTTSYAKNRFIPDLPSQSFNHVILCVPLTKDTMWLECTSQQIHAGYMSDFTANRKALLITENGGVVVSTPSYKENENRQLRKIKAAIDDEGSLSFEVKTNYAAVQQDDLDNMVNNLPPEKIKEFLEKNLPLSTYTINNFNYKQNKTQPPSIDEELNVTATNYATITGKRIFLVPDILNKSGLILLTDSVRTSDFIFSYAYHDQDEVEITVPAGYTIESSPKNVELKTAFASYSINCSMKDNKIIYTRTMEQHAGRFKADMQKEILEFYNGIYKSDRSRVVLVKSDK